MNAATQELLSLLQSGAHDEDCLGRIRIFATGARKDLVQTADRDTLGDLHAMLRAWAEAAPPELGAQVLTLAAQIAEDDLDDASLAIGDYDRALELAPDVDLTRALADVYARRGTEADRKEAADLYAAAGEALGEADGVEVLERALQLVPGHEGALAAAEALPGHDPRFLLPHWERYLEVAGDTGDPVTVARRRLALGRAYDEEGRFRDAMLVIAPLADRGDAQALILRDILLAKLENESEQAVPTFEPTRGLRPRSGDTMVGFKLPTADVDDAVARAKAAVANRQPNAAAAATPAATAVAASVGFEPTQPSLPHPTIDPSRQAPDAPRPLPNPFAVTTHPVVPPRARPLAPVSTGAVDPRAHTAPSMPYAAVATRTADPIAATAPSMPHAVPASTPPPAMAPALDTQDSVPFAVPKPSRKPWIIAGVLAALAVVGVVFATSDANDASDAAATTTPPAAEAPATPEAEATPAEPEPTPAQAEPAEPEPEAEPTEPAAAAEGPSEPAAAATPTPSTDEPPTKPRATKPATSAANGKVEVAFSLMRVRGGTLTREQLEKATSKARPKLQDCYDSALERDPKVNGRIVLEWTVRKDGKVKGVRKSRDTARDAKLYQCVADTVRDTKFAAPKGGEAKVRLPFDFNL